VTAPQSAPSRTIVALLIALRPTCASAGEIDVFNQLSQEASACAAYYNFAKQCAPTSAAPAELAKIESSGEAASQLAMTFGRSAGMSNTAMAARLTFAVQSAAMAMKAGCANFSVLRDKYQETCAALLDNPIKRLE
jgi:hypothetical protein